MQTLATVTWKRCFRWSGSSKRNNPSLWHLTGIYPAPSIGMTGIWGSAAYKNQFCSVRVLQLAKMSSLDLNQSWVTVVEWQFGKDNLFVLLQKGRLFSNTLETCTWINHLSSKLSRSNNNSLLSGETQLCIWSPPENGKLAKCSCENMEKGKLFLL